MAYNGTLGNLQAAFPIMRPWVGMVANQDLSFCGGPVCNPFLVSTVQAFEPWRWDTGLVAIQAAATPVPTGGGGAQAANVDGDNLLIPQAASLTLFQNGIGDPEQISDGTTWWNATPADKDLNREGAPTDEPFYFIVTGFCFEVPEVFQRGGTFTAAGDPVVFAPWLTDQADGSQYSARIQRSLLNDMVVLATFGDSGCTFRLGPLKFYPPFFGARGGQLVGSGLVSMPLVYTPLMTAMAIGFRDDSRQLSLALQFGQATIIQNDPTNPTISGTTIAGVINSTNIGTVFAKVLAMALGFPVCMPLLDCYAINQYAGGYGAPGGMQGGQSMQAPVANAPVAANPNAQPAGWARR